MEWRTADSSVAVAVSFLADGEFVIPDVGSLTLTLRGNDGAVLSGFNELPVVDQTSSTMLLTIPAEVNGIGSNAMETRYLRLSFLAAGVPCVFEYTYRLTPFIPLAATAADVRRAIGVDFKTLPDSEVDLYESYFKLKKNVGALFVTALTSGTHAAISANNMVALQAALLLIPSLQNRVMKSETSHNEIFIRNTLDLVALQAALEDRLRDETAAMQDDLGNPVTTVIDPIFFVTTPVDVITGA